MKKDLTSLYRLSFVDKKYVFVVDEKNTVKSREIEIGATLEDLYVVSEGLTEKDRILLEGLRKVRDNDKIAYEYQEPKMVMASLKVYAE